MHRLTTVLASRDAQRLLQRDGQYASDAPWIHAFGEDDEFFRFPGDGEDAEFLLSPSCGEDDGDPSCNVTVSIRATRRGSTPSARMTSSFGSPDAVRTTGITTRPEARPDCSTLPVRVQYPIHHHLSIRQMSSRR